MAFRSSAIYGSTLVQNARGTDTFHTFATISAVGRKIKANIVLITMLDIKENVVKKLKGHQGLQF